MSRHYPCFSIARIAAFIEERSVDLYVHDEGRQRDSRISRRHLGLIEHSTDGTDKTLPRDPEIIIMKK